MHRIFHWWGLVAILFMAVQMEHKTKINAILFHYLTLTSSLDHPSPTRYTNLIRGNTRATRHEQSNMKDYKLLNRDHKINLPLYLGR